MYPHKSPAICCVSQLLTPLWTRGDTLGSLGSKPHVAVSQLCTDFVCLSSFFNTVFPPFSSFHSSGQKIPRKVPYL